MVAATQEDDSIKSKDSVAVAVKRPIAPVIAQLGPVVKLGIAFGLLLLLPLLLAWFCIGRLLRLHISHFLLFDLIAVSVIYGCARGPITDDGMMGMCYVHI